MKEGIKLSVEDDITAYAQSWKNNNNNKNLPKLLWLWKGCLKQGK